MGSLATTFDLRHGPSVRIGRLRVPLLMTLVAGMLLVILWYVIAANAYVGMTYAVSSASQEAGVLGDEIEELEGSMLDSVMLEELEARAGTLGFTPVKNPTYLAVPGAAVARR